MQTASRAVCALPTCSSALHVWRTNDCWIKRCLELVLSLTAATAENHRHYAVCTCCHAHTASHSSGCTGSFVLVPQLTACCCCHHCRATLALWPLLLHAMTPDNNINLQVRKLNDAFQGAVKFVAEVRRYLISAPNSACPQTYSGCIVFSDWWDTTMNGHLHDPVFGEFSDENLVDALAANLNVYGPRPLSGITTGSVLNVYMWDW